MHSASGSALRKPMSTLNCYELNRRVSTKHCRARVIPNIRILRKFSRFLKESRSYASKLMRTVLQSSRISISRILGR